MVIDQNFCTISIALWIAIWMSSILWGLLAGYALQTIFAQAGFGPSNSAVQNFTGGYLLPVTFGILSGFGVDRLLPAILAEERSRPMRRSCRCSSSHS